LYTICAKQEIIEIITKSTKPTSLYAEQVQKTSLIYVTGLHTKDISNRTHIGTQNYTNRGRGAHHVSVTEEEVLQCLYASTTAGSSVQAQLRTHTETDAA
ncbi:hypothetical protein ACJX0J_028451, partial [Zea mays]